MGVTMAIRLAVLIGIVATAASAGAAEVRGTFSALMTAREVPRGELSVEGVPEGVTDYPLYGLAAVQVDELGVPGVDDTRLVMQGWGRLQLGDEEVMRDDSADLQLLYAEGRRGPLHVRVGRQHLMEGGDRLALIDGAEVGVHTPIGIIATAFGGLLVRRELDIERGDWIGGGRLAYRLGLPGEVGLSYSQRRLGGEIASEEVAADGFYQVGPARIVGLAVVGPTEERLVEARLAVSYAALQNLVVTADVERTSPDLLIPRTSIFSVFAETTHDAIGGDLQWDPSPYYGISAEGHWLRLEDESMGYRATVRAATYREPSRRSTLGLEVRRVDESDSGYVRGRVFTALQLFAAVRVAADLFAYQYDEEINEESASYLASLSGTYDIAPSMRVIATVQGGMTPYAESQVEGFLRFAYGFETDLAREWTP